MLVLKAEYMQSAVMINEGSTFRLTALPPEAQFFPVYALAAGDYDGDGRTDILLGGNQYRAKPETGIYDAGYGLLLKEMPSGRWQVVPADSSGFSVRGEIRDFGWLGRGKEKQLMVIRNNDSLVFFKTNEK